MKETKLLEEDAILSPVYGSKWDTQAIPEDKIPQDSMRSDEAYQIIYDKMNLQGNANLNLASFVTTWMEPEAIKLMKLGGQYNLVDDVQSINKLLVEHRDKTDLPEELPFEINYLGGTMTNYSLNFSKTSSNLLAQYYNFLRFGKTGYKEIMDAVMSNAHYLEQQLVETGYFEILTDTKYLPVVVITLKDDSDFSAYDISKKLSQYGWIVPAYSLPKNSEEIVVLRMVVKENFSRDFAQKLIKDINKVLKELANEEIIQEERFEHKHKGKIKSHGVC